MNENKTNAGAGEEKSDLDLLEEALVGTHQEVAGSDAAEEQSEAMDEPGPPVPGHRSP